MTATAMLVGTRLLPACSSADVTLAHPGTLASATHQAAPSGLSSYRSTRTHDEVPLPVRLRIPSINLDTGLEDLGRATDQSIEVPRGPTSAGWWTDGLRPGQVGPAVVLGQADSKTGPAVFFRLGALVTGADVFVDRAEGIIAHLRPGSLDRFDKDESPTELVDYPTLKPEFLVTCGGPIDPSTGHHRDNFVVFAIQPR